MAVKLLLVKKISSDERIKFLKEANIMMKLDHVSEEGRGGERMQINVVKFFGVCGSSSLLPTQTLQPPRSP